MSSSSPSSTPSGSMSESDFYHYLAFYYCPIWYFHRDEKYFPSSVEYAISHSELLFLPNVISTIEANEKRHTQNLFQDIPTHDISKRIQIMSQCCKSTEHNIHRQYRLNVAKHTYPGYQPSGKIQSKQQNGGVDYSEPFKLSDAPIYVQVRSSTQQQHDDDGSDYIDIVYHVYCCFNGPVCLPSPLSYCIDVGDLGTHQSDWEHVTCRMKINKRHNGNSDQSNEMTTDFRSFHHELHSIYLSAHGDLDGAWFHHTQMQYEHVDINPSYHSSAIPSLHQYQQGQYPLPAKRVVVYAAKYGHGHYRSTGVHRYGYGFINDYTNKGFKWIPVNNVVLLTHKPAINNNTTAEKDGTGDPYNPHTADWLDYNGLWGISGIDSLCNKGYWSCSENPLSNTSFRRFFCWNSTNEKYFRDNLKRIIEKSKGNVSLPPQQLARTMK